MTWYRRIWVIIDLLLLIGAIIVYAKVDVNTYVNDFTYWGFVVAVVGIIISILEVLNTLSSINSKFDIMSIAECADILDRIIDSINAEQFENAIIFIREIRKIAVKTTCKKILDEKILVNRKKFTFYDMESNIESYRTAQTSGTRIAKDQIVNAKKYYVQLRTKLLGTV